MFPFQETVLDISDQQLVPIFTLLERELRSFAKGYDLSHCSLVSSMRDWLNHEFPQEPWLRFSVPPVPLALAAGDLLGR